MTDKLNDIDKRLLNSSAVCSLNLETDVYDLFKKYGWKTEHSPYYTDNKTGKNREIDIKARKYWHGPSTHATSCEINFIVECKSIKDYHIVVSNRLDYSNVTDLIHSWIGNDSYHNYSKTIELLKKHDVSNDNIKTILKELNLFCYPKGLFKFLKYRVDAFDIPVFNSFRETNIGTTKDSENSVVWKAFQSLYSCAEIYDEFDWSNIDYHMYDIEKEKLNSDEEKANKLLDALTEQTNHISYVHPLLVVESNMWELKKEGLEKLKYFRLLFQKVFDEGIWMDVVNKEYLNEYLNKTKQYDKYLLNKKFKRG